MNPAIHPHLLNLSLAANALKNVEQEVVFVGGATTILYVDNDQASDPRPTMDVDCVVEISTLARYHALESELRKLGFKNDNRPKAPICRWLKDSLIVDIMPTNEKILGFSNRWYELGFKQALRKVLVTEQSIKIFSFPYFIASKLEALKDRGLKDIYVSQDLEDILFILEGRKTFFDDLSKASEEIAAFAKKVFQQLTSHSDFENAARGNLPRGLSRERESMLIEKIKTFSQ